MTLLPSGNLAGEFGIWAVCVVSRARGGISFDTTDGNNESARRREATCFLRRILIRNAELGLLNLLAPPISDT